MSNYATSTKLVSEIAAAVGAEVENSGGIPRAGLRKGPLSIRIVPSIETPAGRIVFVHARGYEGVDEVIRGYDNAADAAADVAIFFATGAL